jgi:hypothetical protein
MVKLGRKGRWEASLGARRPGHSRPRPSPLPREPGPRQRWRRRGGGYGLRPRQSSSARVVQALRIYSSRREGAGRAEIPPRKAWLSAPALKTVANWAARLQPIGDALCGALSSGPASEPPGFCSQAPAAWRVSWKGRRGGWMTLWRV